MTRRSNNYNKLSEHLTKIIKKGGKHAQEDRKRFNNVHRILTLKLLMVSMCEHEFSMKV